jgi:hypothetical protein
MRSLARRNGQHTGRLEGSKWLEEASCPSHLGAAICTQQAIGWRRRKALFGVVMSLCMSTDSRAFLCNFLGAEAALDTTGY